MLHVTIMHFQQLALRIVSQLGLASGLRSLWGVNVELYIIATSSDARQGKESGDPTVPAIGIATGRPGRHSPVYGRPGPWSLSAIYPLNHESRVTPRSLAR